MRGDEENRDPKETEMYSHPETLFLVSTEVQRQYLADAEQHRRVATARRLRKSRRSRRNVRDRH
jgi:hypothetical protein